MSPTLSEDLTTALTNGRFSHFVPSNSATYQAHLIGCAGDLENAATLLRAGPERQLLDALADHTSPKLPGWISAHPSPRRLIHQGHAAEILKQPLNGLPAPLAALLRLGLVETGFFLLCRACACHSWYSSALAAGRFRCGRCELDQAVPGTPDEVYKLQEAIFQGFTNNFDVPVLALDALRRRAAHGFDYMLEIDAIGAKAGNAGTFNLDIICRVDGTLHVGEAKCNGKIDARQLRLYKQILTQLPGCTFVIATTKTWNQPTRDAVAHLVRQCGVGLVTLEGRELLGEGGL